MGTGQESPDVWSEAWAEPLKWNAEACREGRSHRVFCSSMCDYLEDHPVIERERAKLWQLIRSTPHLDWQLLTKRSDRIADNLPSDWGSNGYANVWLGVSIENMEYANRADDLRSVPAAVRFISYEPALGPLDALPLEGLDWVIFGGESGPQYREADLQWSRDMHNKCITKVLPTSTNNRAISSLNGVQRSTEKPSENIQYRGKVRHLLCVATVVASPTTDAIPPSGDFFCKKLLTYIQVVVEEIAITSLRHDRAKAVNAPSPV